MADDEEIDFFWEEFASEQCIPEPFIEQSFLEPPTQCESPKEFVQEKTTRPPPILLPSTNPFLSEEMLKLHDMQTMKNTMDVKYFTDKLSRCIEYLYHSNYYMQIQTTCKNSGIRAIIFKLSFDDLLNNPSDVLRYRFFFKNPPFLDTDIDFSNALSTLNPSYIIVMGYVDFDGKSFYTWKTMPIKIAYPVTSQK